jgi:GNAT superfamily N-acetyltransferase
VSRSLAVRPARLDDLDTIVALRLALLREYDDHPIYAGLRDDASDRARDLFRAQITSAYETIFLAERDARVVGILRCVDTPGSPLLTLERYCYVSSVYVLPSHRRSGVLRALLAAADAWCAERGITEMRLHNASTAATAVRAWSALGFEVVEHVRRRALSAPHSPRTSGRSRAGAEATTR